MGTKNLASVPFIMDGLNTPSIITLATGTTQNFNYRSQVDRGAVVGLTMVLDLEGDSPSEAFQNVDINITAGGRGILENIPASWFDPNALNQNQQKFIPLVLGGGQTLTVTVTNNSGATFNAVLILFHENKFLQLEDVNKQGLGLKREAFDLDFADGITEGTINGVFPKNHGNIIGYTIFTAADRSTETFNLQYDLLIDSTIVERNIPMRYNSSAAMYPFPRRPIEINPGGTWELRFRKNNGAAQSASFVIYYGN